MHRVLMCSMVLALFACAKKDAGSSAGSGGVPVGSSAPATKSDSAGSGAAGSPSAGSSSTPASPASGAGSGANDGADEVAALVVHDVGSKALGSQKIDAACVSVVIMPAGDWTVAAAWLKDCGDKTARSILWVYKRKNGNWSEDYVGQPPKCWKGVPADIAEAVTKATKIPKC